MARDWLKLLHLRMPDVKPLYDLKTKFVWKELRNDTINNSLWIERHLTITVWLGEKKLERWEKNEKIQDN